MSSRNLNPYEPLSTGQTVTKYISTVCEEAVVDSISSTTAASAATENLDLCGFAPGNMSVVCVVKAESDLTKDKARFIEDDKVSDEIERKIIFFETRIPSGSNFLPVSPLLFASQSHPNACRRLLELGASPVQQISVSTVAEKSDVKVNKSFVNVSAIQVANSKCLPLLKRWRDLYDAVESVLAMGSAENTSIACEAAMTDNVTMFNDIIVQSDDEKQNRKVTSNMGWAWTSATSSDRPKPKDLSGLFYVQTKEHKAAKNPYRILPIVQVNVEKGHHILYSRATPLVFAVTAGKTKMVEYLWDRAYDSKTPATALIVTELEPGSYDSTGKSRDAVPAEIAKENEAKEIEDILTRARACRECSNDCTVM